MTAEPKNEEGACRAVLEVRDRRRGERSTIVGQPDREERERPAVDLIVKSEAGESAFEHTRVESLPEQISFQKRFSGFINSLERELEGNLPDPGCYRLTLWQNELGQMSKQQLSALQAELASWVTCEAPGLKSTKGAFLGSESVRAVAPPETPVRVRLCRLGLHSRQQFSVVPAIPDDLEDLRAQRMRTAFEAKLPKLHEAKQGGRTSVLVIESDDIALANVSLIADAVISVLKQTGPQPDEVYLVETEVKPWMVWILIEGERNFPDISDGRPFEVSPR